MKILITTPDGNVGRELAKQLLIEGADVRLASHTPEKTRRHFPDADIAAFNFSDEAAIRSALQNVTSLYLASPGGFPAASEKRVVELARDMGVERVVKLGAMGIENNPNDTRRQVEAHIETSGLAWTFLHPSWFMQNYSTWLADGIRNTGVFYEAAGDAKTSFLDVRDIAAVAVKALTEAGHEGNIYTLTGAEALSRDEVAARLSEAVGQEIRYTAISDGEFRANADKQGWPAPMKETYSKLYADVRAGHSAQVTATVSDLLERPALSFAQFGEDYADVWK